MSQDTDNGGIPSSGKRWEVHPNLAGSYTWHDQHGHTCIVARLDAQSRIYARAIILLNRANYLLQSAYASHTEARHVHTDDYPVEGER